MLSESQGMASSSQDEGLRGKGQATPPASRTRSKTEGRHSIIDEEELRKLSELTPSFRYMQVGKVLQIPDAQLRDIMDQSDDISEAFMKVFMRWRDKRPPGTNIRAILAKKLKESGLDEVAGRVHNKSLISNITVVTGNDLNRIIAYEEALRSGKARCNRSRIMVVGPAGIGKTSLIRRLTGQPFNPEEKSTVGTEHNTVKKDVVSGWKLDNDTNKDEVAECMVLHEQSEEQGKALDSSAAPSGENISYSAPSEAAGSSPKDAIAKGKDIEKCKSPVGNRHRALPSLKESGMEDIPPNELKQESLPKKENSRDDSGDRHHREIAQGLTKKRITNATSTANDISYSIWDFGGQVIYYITHPLFLSWRSLYIVVFPFHLDLNAKPPRTEEIKMQGCTPRTHRTILDLLHFWLMSIYVHAVPPNDSKEFEPKILLVGTFQHESSITEEDVRRRVSQIKEMVRGKPYAKQVHSEIVQIDNSSSSEAEVTYIQEQIDKLVKESAYMQEYLPIRWRTFSDKMRALETDTWLLDEARTTMTDVHIIEDIEVELVLGFYHNTGDLIYHQGCELIVLNPQILNNFVSHIITVVDDEKLKGEFGDDWITLIDKGILTMTLLKAVWDSNKGKPNELKYLIDMMVKFDLICKIPEDFTFKGCYFVPCCSRPELNVVELHDEDEKDDEFEFIIDFNKFLPDGFLHRLYVRMASWSMMGPKIPYKPTFHCREMVFYIDELHRVVMTNTIKGDEAHRIKVLIFRLKPKDAPEKSDKCISLKRDFLTYLKDTLKDLKETWARRISYSLGLICRKCRDKGNKFTLISLEAFLECEDSAHCGECHDAIYAGRVKQVFAKPSTRLSVSEDIPSSVSEKELIKLAEDVPSEKYSELCINMGFSFATGGQVLNKHSKDYKQALIEIFCTWQADQLIEDSRKLLADHLKETHLEGKAEKLNTGRYRSKSDYESGESSATKSKLMGDGSDQTPGTSGTRQKRKRKKGSGKGPDRKKSKR